MLNNKTKRLAQVINLIKELTKWVITGLVFLALLILVSMLFLSLIFSESQAQGINQREIIKSIIFEAAEAEGIDQWKFLAMIRVENDILNPWETGDEDGTKSHGLGQIQTATGREAAMRLKNALGDNELPDFPACILTFTVKCLYNAKANARLAANIMKHLLEQTDGDWYLAVWYYNRGPTGTKEDIAKGATQSDHADKWVIKLEKLR